MSCLLRDPIKAFLLQDCITFDKIVGKMEEMTHLFSSCFSRKGQFIIQRCWKGHTTWALAQIAGPDDSLLAAQVLIKVYVFGWESAEENYPTLSTSQT